MAKWISIGSYADADPGEGNFKSEHSSQFLGEISGGDMKIVDAVANDKNHDGIISENDRGHGEDISIDGQACGFDSIQAFKATVELTDGSTHETHVGVVQLTDGQSYIVPISETDLDSMDIQSIDLVSVVQANFSGMWAGSAARSVDNTKFVCFVAGTRIETRDGLVAVEDLWVGEHVRTLDDGFQPLRWVGQSMAPGVGSAAPVRIRAGALAPGVPRRDLWVSQQHRVFIRSKIARHIFGCAEVLAAAKKLAVLPGIDIVPVGQGVTYCHVMLDSHSIILTEGAWSESLLPGPQALLNLGDAARRDIRCAVPDLLNPSHTVRPARLLVRGQGLRQLIARHIKHQRKLVTPMAEIPTYLPTGVVSQRHHAAHV